MNIGIIFGSRSAAHDISILSAYTLMNSITTYTDHSVIPMYITREGGWIVDSRLRDATSLRHLDEFSVKTMPRLQCDDKSCMMIDVSKQGFLSKSSQKKIDILWNVCHGQNGGDGMIASFASMIDVPIVTPGVFAENIALHTYTMKQLLMQSSIPQLPYIYFDDITNRTRETIVQDIIHTGIQGPYSIQTASGGLFTGKSHVYTTDKLSEVLDIIQTTNNEVMVTQGLEQYRVFTCSVIQHCGTLITSKIAELPKNDRLLIGDNTYVGKHRDRLNIPTDIPDSLTQYISHLNKKMYRLFRVQGGAPCVTYIYDTQKKTLYVDDVTMIPLSMQLPLRHKSDISVKDWIQSLIQTAKTTHRHTQKITTYDTGKFEQIISVIQELEG